MLALVTRNNFKVVITVNSRVSPQGSSLVLYRPLRKRLKSYVQRVVLFWLFNIFKIILVNFDLDILRTRNRIVH
jgi:hypothetical protein